MIENQIECDLRSLMAWCLSNAFSQVAPERRACTR